MAERLEILITASDQASKVLGNIDKTLRTGLKVGLAGATAGLALFSTGMGVALNEAMDAEVNVSRLNAVLKSTKGVAGISSDAAQSLADSLSKVTRYSDDAILTNETMLLTFTNIGKEVFPQATEAVLNMGEMFGSTQAAAIQLGKALNDPVAGVSALREVGVSLTEQQGEQVKAMVEAGNMAGAQRIILKELETEFGGVARAAGQTAAGQLTIFKNRLLNIAEGVGTVVLPIMVGLGNSIASKVLPAVERFAENFTTLINTIRQFGIEAEMSQWAFNNAFGRVLGTVIYKAVSLFNIFRRTVQVFTDVLGRRGLDGAFRALFTTFSDGSGFFVEIFETIGLGEETSRKLADVLNSVLGPAFIAIGYYVRVFSEYIGEFGLGRAVRLLFTTFEDGSSVLETFFQYLGIGSDLAHTMADAINAVVGGVMDLISSFASLVGENMGIFIDTVKRVGAVVGALVVGPMAIGVLTGLLGGLGAALGVLLSPIVLVAAGVAALSVAYETNFLGMKDAVDSFVKWFKDTAMPGIINFVKDKVIPGLEVLYDWFKVDALPAIIDFINNDFIPTTLDLWGSLTDIWNKAKPYLDRIYDWFVGTYLPAIGSYITDVAIPMLASLWGEIQKIWTQVEPYLSRLWDWFKVTALPAIYQFLTGTVIPGFNAMRNAIMNVWDWTQPKLQSLYNFFSNNIGQVKTRFIDPLIRGIQNLINKINSIHWPSPPSWLSGAVSSVGGAVGSLKFWQKGGTFSGFGVVGDGGEELVYAPGGAVVFPNDVLRQLGSTTNNYTQNIYAAGNPVRAADDFRLMEAWS